MLQRRKLLLISKVGVFFLQNNLLTLDPSFLMMTIQQTAKDGLQILNLMMTT